MKQFLKISLFTALIALVGFGVGATRVGEFFVRIGSTDAVAEKPAPIRDNLKDIFVDLSKRLVPSVVNIYTTQTVQNPYGAGPQGDLYRRFFEQFFGGQGQGEDFGFPGPQGGGQGGPASKATSLGTGFVIDEKEGLILTNHHVIADADEVKIILTEDDKDREGIDAKVVGGDSEADVALLKIKTDRGLKAVSFGDSDKLEVGEWVMAVGNPFGHGHTVTKGIISAKERTLPFSQFSNFVQTDTPINPGNSGGPLINTAGEVIGINTAINAAAQGIGFAIPINYVKRILPELRTKGAVTRGFIGVNITEVTPPLAKQMKLPKNTRGVIVSEVYDGEPAAKGGLQAYDVILQINDKRIMDGRQLVGAVSSYPPGTKVTVKALRAGVEREFKVTIGKRPDRSALLGQRATPKGRGTKPVLNIGMSVEDLDADLRRELGIPNGTQGVVVSRVTPGGPADEAGFERGDVIVEVDQKATPNTRAFNPIFREARVYMIRFRRADGLAITSLDLTKKEEREE